MAMLARLGSHLRHGNLGKQSFQKTTTVGQQGRTQRLLNPLGGESFALAQTLLEEF
jgi:hypothetical protein